MTYKATVVAASLLALAGCTSRSGPSGCAPPLAPAVQVELYFGLATKGREIDGTEWAAFLSAEVTPRFPDGLSVVDVAGQYRNPSGRITREPSKLLIVIVPDGTTHLAKVQAVVDAYRKQFDQLSVLHVERAVCAVF